MALVKPCALTQAGTHTYLGGHTDAATGGQHSNHSVMEFDRDIVVLRYTLPDTNVMKLCSNTVTHGMRVGQGTKRRNQQDVSCCSAVIGAVLWEPCFVKVLTNNRRG